jgi:hypothetical protein
MDRVAETDKEFACRKAPIPDLSNEKIFPGGIKVKALFTPDMKWRLVEEFGPHCFTEADDGRLLFTADYTDMENLVTWLMTFGAKAEVLEPAEARDFIRRNAEETLKIYYWQRRLMHERKECSSGFVAAGQFQFQRYCRSWKEKRGWIFHRFLGSNER